jgi:hypothetical protein
MQKLTDSQKALRLEFPRRKSVVTRAGSSGTVRGYKGDYVRVYLKGPVAYGLALALRTDLIRD